MAEGQPWYKWSVGSYPYSFDVLDVLRSIPNGFLGGGVGAVLVDGRERAALTGAVLGACLNALVRAQVALEYVAYQLAAPGEPIYYTTPGFTEHQLFVGLIESLVGAGIGALVGYFASRPR